MSISKIGELISEFAPLTLIVDNKGVVIWASDILKNDFSIHINISKFEELFNICIDNIKVDDKNVIHVNNKEYRIKYKEIILYNEKYIFLFFHSLYDDKDAWIFSMRKIIETLNEGIIMCDSNNKILIYNSAMEELEGKKKTDMIGKTVDDVFIFNEENQSIHKKVLETGKPFTNIYGSYVYDKGKCKYVCFSTYPIVKDGEIIGTYSINRNETKLQSLLSETVELKRSFTKNTSDNDDKRYSSNGTRYTFSDIVGCSKDMVDLIKKAETISWLENNILIIGDTGTGKEVFAQSIHNYGKRNKEPFIGINCSAIPENLLESTLFGTVKGAFTGAVDQTGLFEEAREGTLFLDELSSMPISMQVKLLRVLQERTIRRVGGSKFIPIKCRIISAMNEDPQQLIEEGRLRKDLFYRIAGLNLYIPPLKERKEDIFEMAYHYISKYNQKLDKSIIGICDNLKKFMERYEWPGNCRELEYFIQNMIIRTKEEDRYLTVDHIPEYLKDDFISETDIYSTVGNNKSLPNILDNVEKHIIINELDNNDWNITQTARALGIDRQVLYYKMRRLDIEKKSSV